MNIFYQENGEDLIDIGAVIHILLRKAHIIILCALLAGFAAYAGVFFLVTPQYEARITMYVNNRSSSAASFTLTQSDLTASAKLVDTYSAILQNVSVLRDVITDAEVDLEEEELKNTLSVKSVNNTEVFEVSVQHPDPKAAARIVNSIAVIGPERISEIVEGSSVKVINYADIPSKIVSPSYSKAILMGLIFGGFICCALIIIRSLLDTTVKSESDFEVWNYPLLGTIPDLKEAKRMKKSGYGYGSYGKR